MEFSIWSEGYRATGESGGATFHGTYEGDTFRDAVKAWAESLPREKDAAGYVPRELVDLDELTYWACRLFDNEAEARKAFG